MHYGHFSGTDFFKHISCATYLQLIILIRTYVIYLKISWHELIMYYSSGGGKTWNNWLIFFSWSRNVVISFWYSISVHVGKHSVHSLLSPFLTIFSTNISFKICGHVYNTQGKTKSSTYLTNCLSLTSNFVRAGITVGFTQLLSFVSFLIQI